MVCQTALAQNEGLNKFIEFKGESMGFEAVLDGFEKRTGMVFQYDPMLVPQGKSFDLNYKNIKARMALVDFLGRSGLTFSQRGNQLILKKQVVYNTSRLYTFTGRVVQKHSAEYLGGAEVSINNSPIAQYSSEAGYFSTLLRPDTNFITVYYPGFAVLHDTVLGDRDYFAVYELELLPTWLPEAEVKLRKDGSTGSVVNGQPDQHLVTKNKVHRLPHLLGEPDIIRVMSLFPGVVGGSEGMLGMYVRGGSSDQNLVLLDDVPVFNPSHLYGIFSIFNDDAIKSATLLKGSFPAKYGGRLSSVVNVQSKEGNAYRIKGTASVGILSSKIFLEGPLIKNRTTFTLAFRRSYLDFLAKPLSRLFLFNDSLQNNIYYFWDLNARVTHRFSSRSRLSLSFYNGQDVGGINEKNGSVNPDVTVDERRQQLSNWGNLLGSAKWNYYLGRRTGITVKAHITQYDYSFNQAYKLTKDFNDPALLDTKDETRYKLQNGIRDMETGLVLSHKFNNQLNFDGGVGYAIHQFIPGNRTFTTLINGNATDVFYNDPTIKTPEFYGFGEWNAIVKRKLYLDLGLRISSYKINKFYNFVLPEPRVALRYRVGEHSWFKAGIMRTRQFFHLLNNLSLGLPSDLWVPSVEKFKPSRADQASIGYVFNKNGWGISTDLFYKKLNNILEYKDNAGYVTSATNWEEAVTSGTGEAYGWELMTEKSVGRVTGWFSYAWMYNWRSFAELNGGSRFPARYDRRHNLYIAGVYKINDHIDFSLSWTYNSGFAITTPIGKYTSPTPYDPYREIYLYGKRNNTRTRDNHRLDIAFNLEKKHRGKKMMPGYIRTWSLGFFNLYNRRNPFYVNLGYGKTGTRVLYQVSLLPILPNVSYKISF